MKHITWFEITQFNPVTKVTEAVTWFHRDFNFRRRGNHIKVVADCHKYEPHLLTFINKLTPGEALARGLSIYEPNLGS